jgi:hypothetical protein
VKKFIYKPAKNVTVEFQASTDKEAWKEMASVAEMFSVSRCGNCDEDALIPIIRKNADDNEFFELKCAACGYKLSFGQNKVGGGLYPRLRYHAKHPDVESKKVKKGDIMPRKGFELFTYVDNDKE